MTNFEAAIKLPFSNWKRYFIGAGFYFVVYLLAMFAIGLIMISVTTPVFGGLKTTLAYANGGAYFIVGLALLLIAIILGFFPSGYLLRCTKNASEGNFMLPEWKNWGDLWVKGLLITIVVLLYMLPVYVIDWLQTISANTILATVLGAIILIYCIAFYYIIPLIWAKFINEGFKAAFGIADIFKRAFTTKYFVGILGIIGITLVGGILLAVLFVLLFMTRIGIILAPFLYGLGYTALYTMIMAIAGQLYAETAVTAKTVRKPLVAPAKKAEKRRVAKKRAKKKK